MNILDNNFTEFAEKEMKNNVQYYAKELSESKATEIAKEIVKLIDWNNSALMHKGLSWIAQNYLKMNKIS